MTMVRLQVDGETVVRAYTPTSSDDDLGFFELVIKIYFAKENPRFPDGGKMSQWFHRLELGQSLEVCDSVVTLVSTILIRCRVLNKLCFMRYCLSAAGGSQIVLKTGNNLF